MATKLYKNISLMATPTDGTHLVSKSYVDAAVNRKLKDAVTAVSTQNIDGTYDSTAKTLTQTTPAVLTVDGVVLAENDRVLLAGQTDGTQNGIYTVTTLGTDTVAAVLTRAEDFDDSAEIPLNVIIPVMQGDQNGDSNFQLVNDSAITLDTTPLTFAKFKGSEGAMAYTTTITGNGTDKEYTVSHGLNTESVVVSIVDAATKEQCIFGVTITSANVVTIVSDVVLETTDSFIVTVLG